MKAIKVLAPAKINLFLELINRRPDGYHNLITIMQEIDLYDEISFEINSTGDIVLTSSNKDLACDESNLIYKACKKIKERFSISAGFNIFLQKNIPMGAGLGGGSSDAASAIKALVKLFDIKCSKSILAEIASKLGADTAFFLTGHTALCEGIGEIVTPLNCMGHLSFVLVNPNYSIATADIFKTVKFPLTTTDRFHKIRSALTGPLTKDIISKMLFNRLEEFVLPYHPEIVK
ncbi:MAG: 4-(cytidine 5'-diphospho)-2-C-methyl-D-erythritol kinase, partial [Elusimicrobiota bacterium]|nr:4-(cytidine 5'-diphospho)-2-C-methyl-D-erythritol kinase [Elusimicrobiota bacterium]